MHDQYANVDKNGFNCPIIIIFLAVLLRKDFIICQESAIG